MRGTGNLTGDFGYRTTVAASPLMTAGKARCGCWLRFISWVVLNYVYVGIDNRFIALS